MKKKRLNRYFYQIVSDIEKKSDLHWALVALCLSIAVVILMFIREIIL